MSTSETMKRALVIGIDHYPRAALKGCVRDAKRVAKLLERHGDHQEQTNFDCEILISIDGEQTVTREKLKERIKFHLGKRADSQLIYFSGHGSRGIEGGYLITEDYSREAPGVAFQDIIEWVNSSEIDQVTLILDCCHSGSIGENDQSSHTVRELREGVSILASSLPEEESRMDNRGSEFTNILVNGLEGQASDILGRISVAGLYNQVDSLLSSLDQRPMLKAHLSRMAVLRRVEPRVSPITLRKIVEYFSSENYHYPLDPSYEKTEEPLHAYHEAVFADLQAFVRQGLVYPIGEQHMYEAALNSKQCGLTNSGKFYWKLVQLKRI